MRRRGTTRRRRCRGHVTVEATMVILLLSLMFMGLAQITYVYVGQLIAHHTAFVTTRSYVVGYHPELVQRAKEVGSIGLAGPILEPYDATGLSPLELSAREPMLIQEHIENGSVPGGDQWTTLDYTYWPQVFAYGVYPWSSSNEVADVHVRVWDYPLDMPMSRAFVREGGVVDLDSRVRMLHHAEAYLE